MTPVIFLSNITCVSVSAPNLSPVALHHFNDEEDTLWSELSKISPESISAEDRTTLPSLHLLPRRSEQRSCLTVRSGLLFH
jgi:hypothetical protein